MYEVRKWFAEKKGFYLGEGIVMEDCRKAEPYIHPVIIPNKTRNAHCATLGGSRSGKSQCLLSEIEYGIVKLRNNMLIIDPKPEPKLFPAIKWAAKKAGREKEIIVLNAIEPETSTLKFNPFAGYRIYEEIVDNLVAGIPVDSPTFFVDQARKVATVAIKIDMYLKQKLGREPVFPISRLLEILQQSWIMEHIEIIKMEYSFHPENKELAILINLAKSLTDLQSGKFEEVCSSLSNVVAQLSTGIISQLIDTDVNPIFDRLWSDTGKNGEGVICYFFTGALFAGDKAYALSRIFLSALQSFCGRVYVYKGSLARPLEVHIDEASNVFYERIVELQNKAAGAGVWLHFLTQSIADIDSKIGDKRREVILDSCANKVILVSGSAKSTGNYAAELAGEMTQHEIIMRTGSDMGSGSMIREATSPIFDQSTVSKLKYRQFVGYFRDYGNFIGKIKDIPDPPNLKEDSLFGKYAHKEYQPPRGL